MGGGLRGVGEGWAEEDIQKGLIGGHIWVYGNSCFASTLWPPHKTVVFAKNRATDRGNAVTQTTSTPIHQPLSPTLSWQTTRCLKETVQIKIIEDIKLWVGGLHSTTPYMVSWGNSNQDLTRLVPRVWGLVRNRERVQHIILWLGYDSFKMWAQPVHELVKPGLVLAARCALSNEGGVGGKYHAFPDTPIPLPTDLAIVKLEGVMLQYSETGHNGYSQSRQISQCLSV